MAAPSGCGAPRRHRLHRVSKTGIVVAALLSVAVAAVQRWSVCWVTGMRSIGDAASVSASAGASRTASKRRPVSTSVGGLTHERQIANTLRRAANQEGDQPTPGKRLLVLGGNGYVGSQVCRLAVDRGWSVTSLSRRGEKPPSGFFGFGIDERLDKVNWVQGDATDLETVKSLVAEHDAVVHAIGLLFDANSGLANLSVVVSYSNSVPGETSTYDRITRQTAFNVIEAVKQKSSFTLPFLKGPPTPVLFVSAAEAGWPEVAFGEEVEAVAPDWLKEYLVAKRAVEAEITSSPEDIRPVVFRPSLIWSWDKLDVLPVIPIFNFLNAIGIPFVDKTVTVFSLSKAIVAGLEDIDVSGVQRFPQIEELEKQFGE